MTRTNSANSAPDLLASCVKALVDGLTGATPDQIEPGLTFVEFVNRVKPKYRWSRMHKELSAVLQRAADGELRRIMVFMPPRHGKSELVSRLFPAYYLYRYPDRWAALASYGASLAEMLSKSARGYYREIGGELDPSASGVKLWQTKEGGGCWAVGRGGSATGKGWNLGIIDDPLKDAEEADSDVIRDGMGDWYESVFYTRAEDPDLLIVIHTRWHEDDMGGRLLVREREESESPDGEPEYWYVVDLAAVALGEDRREYPVTCTVHPDWRKKGEALWPERFPETRLARIRRNAGTWWEPLYQQNPVAPGGAILPVHLFRVWPVGEKLPLMVQRVLGVDLAISTKDTADYTVVMPLSRSLAGDLFLHRPFRERVEAPEQEAAVLSMAAKFRPQRIGVESVAYQGSFVQRLRRNKTLMTRVEKIAADKDKSARARGWAPLLSEGRIYLVDDGSGWVQDLLDEAKKFPKGKHDDMVDAIGFAIAVMILIVGMLTAPLVGGRRDDPMKPR